MGRTVFGHELIGREIYDKGGELLGNVSSIQINSDNGVVEFLLVKLTPGLDATKLPWVFDDDFVQVPPSEIERVESTIQLRR